MRINLTFQNFTGRATKVTKGGHWGVQLELDDPSDEDAHVTVWLPNDPMTHLPYPHAQALLGDMFDLASDLARGIPTVPDETAEKRAERPDTEEDRLTPIPPDKAFGIPHVRRMLPILTADEETGQLWLRVT